MEKYTGVGMDEKELFLQAQKGDKEAREALFEKNAGLIHHVIKKKICFNWGQSACSRQLRNLTRNMACVFLHMQCL